jgi:hypothetical protein
MSASAIQGVYVTIREIKSWFLQNITIQGLTVTTNAKKIVPLTVD